MNVADFEGGRRGPRAKGCEWLLETLRGKGTDSALAPPEGMQPY